MQAEDDIKAFEKFEAAIGMAGRKIAREDIDPANWSRGKSAIRGAERESEPRIEHGYITRRKTGGSRQESVAK